MEHVRAVLDESEPGFHRPSAGLAAALGHEDPIDEIGILVACPRGQLESLGGEPDSIVEPTLVLGQGCSSHLPAPGRQRVVPPVGVLLESGDGVVECRSLPDLEVMIDTPAKRPSEVILEVRVAAEEFEAVGDLQTMCGVQRAGRQPCASHAALRPERVTSPDASAARRFCWASDAISGHPGEIRRKHDHLALQA